MIFDFGFSILECRSLSEGESDEPIQNEKPEITGGQKLTANSQQLKA
jgi:hypothetical protein